MKRVIRKLCIICQDQFYRHARARERTEGYDNQIFKSKPVLRSINSNTCSGKCSRHYNRISKFIHNQKFGKEEDEDAADNI